MYIIPDFSGWRLNNNINPNIKPKKTTLTFLPQNNAPDSSFETIYKYLRYMQKLSAEPKKRYVNIHLNVVAAINPHKLVWKCPDTFTNVLIHVGDVLLTNGLKYGNV